jgi:hypothetical protein
MQENPESQVGKAWNEAEKNMSEEQSGVNELIGHAVGHEYLDKNREKRRIAGPNDAGMPWTVNHSFEQ